MLCYFFLRVSLANILNKTFCSQLLWLYSEKNHRRASTLRGLYYYGKIIYFFIHSYINSRLAGWKILSRCIHYIIVVSINFNNLSNTFPNFSATKWLKIFEVGVTLRRILKNFTELHTPETPKSKVVFKISFVCKAEFY